MRATKKPRRLLAAAPTCLGRRRRPGPSRRALFDELDSHDLDIRAVALAGADRSSGDEVPKEAEEAGRSAVGAADGGVAAGVVWTVVPPICRQPSIVRLAAVE